MPTAQVRSIASLKRGLDVLSMVSAHDGLVLHALHVASGIAKASLLRILKTLTEHQLVRKRDGDGAYLPTHKASVSNAPNPAPTSIRATACRSRISPSLLPAPSVVDTLPALLARLRQQLDWPSDVAALHGSTMRVIDSNRALYGPAWRPSVIGEDIDLLDSAMGRAYLAHMPPAFARPLVDALLAGGGSRARRREALEHELWMTHRRGFGARDDFYAGPDTHHGRQLSAIAVPILCGDTVVACVSCVWSLSTHTRAEVVEQALAHLVRAASVAGDRLTSDAQG